MPELRKDPLVSRWVVMAPERAARPHDEKQGESPAVHEIFDAFAEGNEWTTTPEVLALRDGDTLPDGPGWRVRVVPNKFPALQSSGNLTPRVDGIYESMEAVGAHEVTIECPQNESHLSRLSIHNIQEVLGAYRQRLIDLKQDGRFVHALIFKNQGILAGASLRHTHSQLMALPIVPVLIRDEIQGALEYFTSHGHSLFDAMIQQEISSDTRVVLDSPNFLVICPFASRFPYEMCILPKRQASHFESTTQADLGHLAGVLKNVLGRLEAAASDPAYNYVLHSAPFNQPELPYFQWHIEILPRVTRVAGFEWGSGFFVNEVLPEVAASKLREACPGTARD